MSAVTNALDAFQQCLDGLGNEDHWVGLCDCEDRRLIAEARTAHDDLVAALKKVRVSFRNDPMDMNSTDRELVEQIDSILAEVDA